MDGRTELLGSCSVRRPTGFPAISPAQAGDGVQGLRAVHGARTGGAPPHSASPAPWLFGAGGHQLVCRRQNLVRGASQLRGPEEEGEQVPGGALGGEGQSGPVSDGRLWVRAWFESSHTAPAEAAAHLCASAPSPVVGVGGEGVK